MLRPLLSVPRSEIERYIAENGIEYVTDSTNLEPCCARNVIRSRCVPALCELSPHAPEDETLLSALASLPEDGLKRLTELLVEYRTDTDGEYGTGKSATDTSGAAYSGAAQAGIGSAEYPETDRPRHTTGDSIRNTYDSIKSTDPADSIENTAAAAHIRSTDSITVPDRLPAPLLRRRLLSFYRDYCARRGISADPGSDNIEALARLCRVGATHEELSLPGAVRATKLRGGIMLSPDIGRGADRAPSSGDSRTRTTAANDGDYPAAAAGGSASCDKTDGKTYGDTYGKTCGKPDGGSAAEYPLRPGCRGAAHYRLDVPVSAKRFPPSLFAAVIGFFSVRHMESEHLRTERIRATAVAVGGVEQLILRRFALVLENGRIQYKYAIGIVELSAALTVTLTAVI